MISEKKTTLSKKLLKEGFELMATAKSMAEIYEENFKMVSKYVHATSRGHEAIQLAVGLQLKPYDFAFPYYRDDAMLLAMGFTPHDLMLQLLAKKEDPFSGGRSYYSHPSSNQKDKPKIPHQSSATGMQAIPATGVGLGIRYLEKIGESKKSKEKPIVLCSFGDASITEGEVAEAFQMASLKELPVLFLVQDNNWNISATAEESRSQNAAEYSKGFSGITTIEVDGTDFNACYIAVEKAIAAMRKQRKPFLIHAKVPLLNHHTSGVRMEWYRDDLDDARKRDPYPKLKKYLLKVGISSNEITNLENKARDQVFLHFKKSKLAEEPRPDDLFNHEIAPTPITIESGERSPENADRVVMVDCALHAIEELMTAHKECLFYGQDVGRRLGGVFREAATLAAKFGDDRVFNTPIQEAFIVGSTVGMSACGLKPIVEVQFADYIWPGLNQLFTEVSRSYYLSNGKWPVNMVLRVPTGAYGSGGPYHSSSIESVVATIRGIKIAYPSNGADLKGLIKAAYHDPNPVVIFEHKGLYWSKLPGTEYAKSIEPASDYTLPFGTANIVLETSEETCQKENTLSIVTYGMGVHWALNAADQFKGKIEIVDLRTLAPLDKETVFSSVRKNGRCLVLTEEVINNSFAQALSGLIQENCFQYLDGPVYSMGALPLPAIPLNSVLESAMLPSTEKVVDKIQEILNF